MSTVWYVIAAILIVVGLAGAIVPLLPGIPLIFAGIWLIAGVDHYQHLGLWWLVGIALRRKRFASLMTCLQAP